MILSDDAIVFGFSYLPHGKATLSFGGASSVMRITPRARAALQELIDTGYAVACEPNDPEAGREGYAGVNRHPSIGDLTRDAKLNPFSEQHRWACFVKSEEVA